MTKFKDVAHLYLGCQLYSKATGEMVGTLEGVVCNKAHFRVRGVWASADISCYKPALRPLDSMTDDEAVIVAKMATHLHDSDSWKLLKVVRSNGMIKVYFTDRWTIDTTKDYYVKVSPYPLQGVFISYKGEILDQQHYQFPLNAYLYLISKGFDLFSLIPNGEAIDKTQNHSKWIR